MRHYFKITILILMIISVLCSCNPGQQSGVTPTGQSTAEEKIKIAKEIYSRQEKSVPTEPKEENFHKQEVKVELTEDNNKAENKTEIQKSEPKITTDENPQLTDDGITTCSITVRCDSVFSNMDKLKDGKELIIPQNGIIYENKSAVFYEGESVFNILSRELKRNKVHFEYEYTPMYNSTYIEGIGNLYEFDCGDLSGWLYKVNGKSPECGCSQYILKDGDVVEFLYSCNMGIDVGGYKDVTGD